MKLTLTKDITWTGYNAPKKQDKIDDSNLGDRGDSQGEYGQKKTGKKASKKKNPSGGRDA